MNIYLNYVVKHRVQYIAWIRKEWKKRCNKIAHMLFYYYIGLMPQAP